MRSSKRIKKSNSTIQVSEAVQEYLQSSHVRNLSARTQEEYIHELGVFCTWCECHQISTGSTRKALSLGNGIMLDQIDQYAVRLFLEDLKVNHIPRKSKEMSTYTLAGYVRVIKSFLNWCLHHDEYMQFVSADTIQRIEKPQVIETIIESFSSEQIKALFKACDKEESEHLQIRDRAIVAVLFDCGLRATELCTLTMGNVSLDAKDSYVRVLGKGNKWGEVGMGEQCRRYVHKYIRMFREPTIQYEMKEKEIKQKYTEYSQECFVFVNRNGEPLTKSGLWRTIDRLGQWAHIEGVRCSPHTFRHTFAANFIRQGGDIYTLSKLLRHSSVSVTELYLKSLQQSEARKGAKSVLDNL